MTIQGREVTLLDIRRDEVKFPRISTYSREEAVLKMTKIVTNAFLYKGHTADPANIQFIASNLAEELRKDSFKLGTPRLTFAEIAWAVKKAVLNDEIYSVSVASLFKVIADYTKGKGHELQKEVDKLATQAGERAQISGSPVATMISAYSGAMVKNTKV